MNAIIREDGVSIPGAKRHKEQWLVLKELP
jgi:hypothetical protein